MRLLMTALAALVIAASAQAHFVFVYVAEGGREARLVLSHTAAPDPNVKSSRLDKSTLYARGADGKETKLTIEKGEINFLRAPLSAEKPVVVYGTTETGVTQRGDNPPVLSFYYPKVIVGDPFSASTVLGDKVPMEIVLVRDGDKVRFKVLKDGKPFAGAEVVIDWRNGSEVKEETIKTDMAGMTVGLSNPGRYCVAARHVEPKEGELDGKKYFTVRTTATLVFDFRDKR